MIRGNKAQNLEKLKKLGYRVPHFVVLSSSSTKNEISEILTKEFRRTIFFAVRSSSQSEDSGETAQAGKFYSAIGLQREEVAGAFQKVVESYGNDDGGVIIQEFIPSDVAGVLFTNNGHEQAIINANIGVCKYVVEGKACDEYTLNSNGRVLQQKISTGKTALLFKNKEFIEVAAPQESLNEKKLLQLSRLAEKIEKQIGSPQDIEWCFYEEKLYLLQTRPVTRELPKVAERIHYDSANIAESYSGIVLPLTLSFASHIYEVVYRNLLHASGVSRRKLRKHPEIFRNMVSWFYGRLYYNMNNWYRMMAFIPGYQRNKQNLEQMITSNIHEEVQQNIAPGILFRIGYPIMVVAKLMVFNQSQRRFRKLVNKEIGAFRKLDTRAMDWESCLRWYQHFDRKLIGKWHIPVENDFLVMTYYGLLQKRISSDELMQKAIRFPSKTSEQIERLQQLSNRLYSLPGAKDYGGKINTEAFQETLRQHPELQAELNIYFLEFGGRYANELKLESADVEEDHEKLLALLSFYKNRKPEIRNVPAAKSNSFGVFDRYLIRKFRKHASTREEMRLLRSNGFSVIRRLMIRMGELLAEEGYIGNANDIFYLTLEEVFGELHDFKSLINSRKDDYRYYRKVTPPAFFSLPEGALPHVKEGRIKVQSTLNGQACSNGVIVGKIRVFEEFYLPEVQDFDIVVARHTDPGWTPLLGITHGLIVEHGGILSHAAIVARELNLPTVIGVENACQILKTGMEVELNGNTGIIKIIKPA